MDIPLDLEGFTAEEAFECGYNYAVMIASNLMELMVLNSEALPCEAFEETEEECPFDCDSCHG